MNIVLLCLGWGLLGAGWRGVFSKSDSTTNTILFMLSILALVFSVLLG